MVSSEKKHTTWWCAICRKNMIGSNGTGLWSYKEVIVLIRAKVFKAHAVPQGLCANLINALKLLANQQEDGDGLLQNIVKDLGEGSRKGLTDGLRELFKKPWSEAQITCDASLRQREDQEALRCHTCARIVTVSRWKTTFGCSLGEKGVTIGGAQSVEKNTTGSNQTGSWWCKLAKVLTRPRSSKRMQYLRAYA